MKYELRRLIVGIRRFLGGMHQAKLVLLGYASYITSKIILWTTFWLSCAGTLLLFVGEPSLQEKPSDERFLGAFFQAMTALTTVGFNTVPIGGLSKASVLLVIVLMVIGSSPSGTGGGLKCTTFSAFLGVMRCAIRGEQEVRFWNRPIPVERIWTAVGIVGFYLFTLLLGCGRQLPASGDRKNSLLILRKSPRVNLARPSQSSRRYFFA